MLFRADDIISSLKKDLLFAHNIEMYNSNVKKYESRANVGIWTRDLFLTKETLYPWATSAVQVVWHDLVERETGFEPATFSLEGWRSTNWATPAGSFVGRAGFEPAKVKTNRFTVCPRWPLEYLPKKKSRWRDSNPRPADYKSAALASWATSACFKKLNAK